MPRAQVTLGEFPGTGDCTVISQGNCCRPSRCTSRALVATPVDTWPKFRVVWTLQEAVAALDIVGAVAAAVARRCPSPLIRFLPSRLLPRSAPWLPTRRLGPAVPPLWARWSCVTL